MSSHLPLNQQNTVPLLPPRICFCSVFWIPALLFLLDPKLTGEEIVSYLFLTLVEPSTHALQHSVNICSWNTFCGRRQLKLLCAMHCSSKFFTKCCFIGVTSQSRTGAISILISIWRTWHLEKVHNLSRDWHTQLVSNLATILNHI